VKIIVEKIAKCSISEKQKFIFALCKSISFLTVMLKYIPS